MTAPVFPDPPELPEIEASAVVPVAKPAPKFETRFARFTDAEYFRDPCSVPALSNSIAHIIETESPLHAWSRHPRLGGVSRAPTKSFDRGSLAHALLLGQGKQIAIIEADEYRTKDAKEARDAARRAGKIPVLVADYEDALLAAEALRTRFAQLGIVLSGESEITALWTETAENGKPVQCRGMLDHWKAPIIYDLKSIRSANPDVCRRHIETYGYASQRAAYVSAVEHIHPELAGRVDFVFVFFELEAPYEVVPVRLSGAFRELGERAWRRSVNRWEHCLRRNEWPGYAAGVIELEPSPWALSRDLDRQYGSEAAHNDNDGWKGAVNE